MEFGYMYEAVSALRGARPYGGNKVRFCNDKYDALAAFYDLGDEVALELQASERKTGEVKFYLQLPMTDPSTTFEGMKSFIDFLYEKKTKDGGSKPQEAEKKDLGGLRILVTCTSGMSSSAFAYRIRQALGNAMEQAIVAAVDFSRVESVLQDYDVVLLAPQVAWGYESLHEKYGDKIIKINIGDYATSNVMPVIRTVHQVTKYPAA